MDRDAFILAMISELQAQKSSSNNPEVFFTGPPKAAVDIYRQLCFDYPAIEKESLLILRNDLRDMLNSCSEYEELLRVFTLNETLLDNIIRLSNVSESVIESNEGNEAGMKLSSGNRKAENNEMQSLALVVFLLFPNWMLQRNKYELSTIFSDNTYSMVNRLPSPHIQELSWKEICNKFRSFVLRTSVSLIQGMTREELTANNCLASMLDSIQYFVNVLTLKKNSTSSEVSEQSSLGQYLSSAVESLDNDAADEAVSCCRDVLSHWIHLYLDILSHVPAAVPEFFPLIFRVLFPFQGSSACEASACPVLSEYIGMKGLGNFIFSLLQTLDANGKGTSALATIEGIRKFLLSEQNLPRLVAVAENVKNVNLTSSLVSENHSTDSIVDMETSIFFIELLDLLVYRDQNSAIASTVFRLFFEKLSSSRLLICGMSVLHQLISLQSSILCENRQEKLRNWTNLWQLSSRYTSVFARLMSISAEARSYFVQSSSFLSTWEQCVEQFVREDFRKQRGAIWLPLTGFPILFSAIYTGRLPGAAIPASTEMIRWNALIQNSLQLTSQMVINLFDISLESIKVGSSVANATEDVAIPDPAIIQEEDSDVVSEEDKSLFTLQRQILESLCASYAALGTNMLKDTIRLNVSINAPFLSELRSETKMILRKLGSFRTQVNADKFCRNPNLQVLERAIRVVKDIDSVLEGGQSSKSD